ncbi:MAG: 2Fe-2S iron-sulfur cluster-binding protein [Candidatus Binatia bacterium]
MATLRVTFESGAPDEVVEFDLGRAPFQHDGLPGSILDVMLGHGIPLEHACGGNCACTTCHVIVTKGSGHLSESSEAEEDMLDKAVGLAPTSRLGCQAVITADDAEVEVVVPRFTVNLAPAHG